MWYAGLICFSVVGMVTLQVGNMRLNDRAEVTSRFILTGLGLMVLGIVMGIVGLTI